METQLIEQVRSFNRTVTERIGVLNDHFLGRDHPLGEARLIWEIGEQGAEVRSLRKRLDLDSAYLSRLLRSLEKQGLVEVTSNKDDGRVREAHLTAVGLLERAELDHRADQFARTLLDPLSGQQREKLAAAMAQVERYLMAGQVTIAVADPASPDAQWCIQQYFAELAERFDAGFDPTLGISAEPHELTLPNGLILVARLREEPVGCGALKFHHGAPTEVKRMWVTRSARGLGLGRRLLQELERTACDMGSTILRLETNRSLKEAIQMYRESGYIEVPRFNDEPYAHHWFEKCLG